MKDIIKKLTTEFKSMKAVGCRIRDNHPDLHKQVLELGNGSFPTGLFMFYNDIENIPMCKECGNTEVKLISFNQGFREFCCGSCSKKYSGRKFLENYNKENNTNYTNIRQIPEIKEKADKTNVEKYGSVNPMMSDSVKEKIKKTSLEKYGVEHPASAEEVRSKAAKTMKAKTKAEKEKSLKMRIETMLENHGVENPMQSQEFQDKAKETRMEKYGVEFILQNPDISARQVETRKRTLLEKYGVEAVAHIPEIAEKMNNPYYNKKFIWKTGEEVTVQGYEDIVLNELEDNGYSFETVLTNKKDMPEILYEFEGKTHRYYPDFYIPSENLIIEVKSEWTLNKQWDKNQAKFKAVKDAGFNFRLEVR